MKKGRLILKILITWGVILLMAACSKKGEDVTVGWKTIETPILDIEVPADWSFVDLQGIDTYNGLLTNTTDSMQFEYGINLDTFAVDTNSFTLLSTTVDGKNAKILEGKGTPSIYGMAVDSARVTTVGSNPTHYVIQRFIIMQTSKVQMNRGTAMKILQSVKFRLE